MKRFVTLVFVLGFACCLYAQTVDTTVCNILDNPQSFNGKIVRIKGTVYAGFDQFVVKGADCGINVNKNIWLSYPEGLKAKAGPAVMVHLQPARNFAGDVPAVQRTPVELDKNNKDFKQFDSLLATPYKKGGMCLGCNKFEVTATLVGRLDAKAHRKEKVFEVKSLHFEPDVAVDDLLVEELGAALQACAKWHKTPKVKITKSNVKGTARPIQVSANQRRPAAS